MNLLKRIEGKTPREIFIMDLRDVLHTLHKYNVGEKNTQLEYALVVFKERIKDLEENRI